MTATADVDLHGLESLVATAGRALSVHNSQPWRFHLVTPRTIELQVAEDRVMPHVDPTGREAVISCGAALHNFLLGLRARGLVGVPTIEPDVNRPLVLASVQVAPADVPTESERRAIAAIYRRHTHRSGFDAPLEDPELLEILSNDATEEGASLVWVTQPETRHKLTHIAHAAEAHQQATPELAADTISWLAKGDERRDGVPRWAFAPARPDDHPLERLPDRFHTDGLPSMPVPGPGTVGVLLTKGDGIQDWLSAGQALQRLLLRAAGDWVFAALNSSATELPRYRDLIRDALETPDYPQMLLEVGHSHHASCTSRLPAALVIEP